MCSQFPFALAMRYQHALTGNLIQFGHACRNSVPKPHCLCPLSVWLSVPSVPPLSRQCPSVLLSVWLPVLSVCTVDSAPMGPCLCHLYVQLTVPQRAPLCVPPVCLVVYALCAQPPLPLAGASAFCMYSIQCLRVPLSDWLSVHYLCTVDSAPVYPTVCPLSVWLSVPSVCAPVCGGPCWLALVSLKCC